MTFKHTKFDDSATMRSLIKVAAEKGWVKPEPLQKTAAASEDLSPSNNLTENVMKLCSGLRASGLDKYADELENKFMQYKQANSLYNVHNEEGKDLINAAHPKGGHKMEDLEGDVLVETILENRLKILNVINKKPTGKLASHTDIMNAVKVILAGDASKVQAKLNKVLASVNTIFELHEQESFISRPPASGKDDLRELINSAINNAGNPEILEGLFYKIKSGIDLFHKAFEPSWTFGSKKEIWNNMVPLFGIAYAALDDAKNLSEETGAPAAPAVVKKPLEDLMNQVNAVKNKVQSWKSIGPIVKQPTAMKWIDTELSNLEDILKRYNAAPEDQHVNLVSSLSKELNAELSDINQFEKNWIIG